jgi:hypothetical protein
MGPEETQRFPCLGAYFFVPAYDLAEVVLPTNAEVMLNEALPGRNIYLTSRDPRFAFELGAKISHYDSREEEKVKSGELIPDFMDILSLKGIAYVLEHRTACVKFHRDAFPDGIPTHTAKIIPFPVRPRPTE